MHVLQEDNHNYVTVMSGTSVLDLMQFELKNKVHLPCNVILTEPMYGGVIGAGCHVRKIVVLTAFTLLFERTIA